MNVQSTLFYEAEVSNVNNKLLLYFSSKNGMTDGEMIV